MSTKTHRGDNADWHTLLRIGLVCLFALAILTPDGVSQETDTESDLRDLLTSEAASPCLDMRFNAERLIPGLYERGQLDSIYLIIDYVSSNCTTSFWRLRTLLDIETNDYSYDKCAEEVNSSLFEPRWHCIWDIWLLDDYGFPGFEQILASVSSEVHSAYIAFVDDYARRVSRSVRRHSNAFAVTRHMLLQHDSLIYWLSLDSLRGTCYQERYWEEIAELDSSLYDFRTHWAVGAGVWVHPNANDILGPKVEIPLIAGLRFDRIGVDALLFLRFLNASEPYTVRHEGSLQETDHFLGGLIGLSMSYELVRTSRLGLDLAVGGGYDGFTAIARDEDDDEDGRDVNSYNIHFSVTQRIMLGKQRTYYLGIRGQYNLVDYDLGAGASDFHGHTVSLNLVFGRLTPRDNYRAERLRYYDLDR